MGGIAQFQRRHVALLLRHVRLDLPNLPCRHLSPRPPIVELAVELLLALLAPIVIIAVQVLQVPLAVAVVRVVVLGVAALMTLAAELTVPVVGGAHCAGIVGQLVATPAVVVVALRIAANRLLGPAHQVAARGALPRLLITIPEASPTSAVVAVLGAAAIMAVVPAVVPVTPETLPILVLVAATPLVAEVEVIVAMIAVNAVAVTPIP